MKKITLFFSVFVTAMLFISTIATAQITTSAMNGKITDEKGDGLVGATVVAIHTPTGSQSGGISDSQGFYHLPNLDVGGPYKVVFSFVGYQNFEKNNIYLTLGQNFALNVKLSVSNVQIEEVNVIVKKNDIFDGNRTGTETVVDMEKINSMPSVARDLSDFTRLTPQASVTSQGGINIAGANSRYNSIFIDGAVNNDVFGLADNGSNGGQIGISPISMDAIEQFQIVIAPFDVRQGGFAGGGINAVTRRGTNDIEGSLYYYYRDQLMAGKTPGDVEDSYRARLDEFKATTMGVRVGGPIIKNKLFFFVNAELQKQDTPQPFSFDDYNGNASKDDLLALKDKLINDYGYDPGTFENNTKTLDGKKLFLRFDYNINNKHKLMLRHSYTYGESISPARSSGSSIRYANGGILFPSSTNSTALELKSRLSDIISNKLIIGYTTVRDDRDPMGKMFPKVNIDDGGGDIYFGSEEYSTANELNQNIFTITDNLQIYKGKHTFTIGTHNEFYQMYNLFIRQNYGVYEYDNLAQFMNGDNATEFYGSYSVVDDITGDGSAAAAEFNAMQLGFYVQDEYQANDKLKVTGGVRLDIPMFTQQPETDDNFNDVTLPLIEAEGYDMSNAKAGQMPSSQILVSPRVGFNYDVNGDKSLQLRGGTGIFTSRIPFVWPGAAYSNNGLMIGNTFATDVAFRPDVNNQYTSAELYPGSTDVPSGDMNLFVDDFKFPQVWRNTLAVDAKLGDGWVVTLEGIYTKTLNNVLYYNYNLKPSDVTLTGTPDDRPIYNRYDNVDGTYGYIMVADNTNEGSTYNITASVRKSFDFGLSGSLAYTYGSAKAVFDGTSSQNSSQWRYMEQSGGRNYVGLTYSDFDLGNRIVGFINYEKEWFGHARTSFSLFYNGQSGKRFSYLYNNYRLTNENSKDMDLIYIPENQSDIIFVGTAEEQQAQWTDLDEYIKQDDYLSEHRGEYAERNGARLPFVSIFDLKITQDFFIKSNGKTHNLQLTLDIFNVGNMLNKDWGRMYYANYYENIRLIRFEGFQEDNTTPTFSFDRPENDEPWDIDDSGINSSRWQAQIGVRYFF